VGAFVHIAECPLLNPDVVCATYDIANAHFRGAGPFSAKRVRLSGQRGAALRARLVIIHPFTTPHVAFRMTALDTSV